ncbi:Arginine biosynthesis bifunctional protein ArgJ [Includes: Glutamate N-acetyltransferase; Amino-acid acetyltransferase] [Candidatus Filomicrobium marinum]|uniref:Arginine biosynthesis bifunctional protein ArgJ n=2 Tax=Filomicrobium TaxID=119044 RepID=A0A0D6JBE6_9HYPH|nr:MULTISPECIES: bifunctional glutamate N-acetyltransferase/amino-acid acetyltransferase ArgJ [Filomicrobium]CFX06339.1 Arginine biosynthesis bifunctional protein ArgJ [Includes: Glutamate N-acetyltransferase; Amino-acid acetyltransferase] [Candidatus Filomicrobium marinum]CPR16415.1 Arginine biosynthesis bifunctional protein ArgJ [Includes: Glutamate N-acetyltransferase; Amino-acid acetyltransferase] [Candidatus Filomicrobium marinum]SDP56008.1 glutamate N-acetyltransferase [Filomicrobium insig
MGSPPPLSPFAPKSLPQAAPVEGVRLAVAEAGIRYKGRKDLMVAVLDPGTVVAGVLTQSKTRSAPVDWCAAQLRHGCARALVVNSGNANAFTGKRGQEAVEITAAAAAEAVGCAPEEVMLASTGVIGEPMDAGAFSHLLKGLATEAAPDALLPAAQAIMTTDTYPKLVSVSVDLDGVPVRIAGFAKGAGMIAPDMATMLSFIFTDAPIAHPVLQALVSELADQTFNCITVDGDTSTSDTVLVFATGKAAERGAAEIADAMDPRVPAFSAALKGVMHDLAMAIVKDGEGLSKFVEIEVTGAESDKAARTIAFSIANSPIMKAAIAGEDPNWGRVVMAVGKSGEAADRDRLSIWFGPHLVAKEGERAPEYVEQTVAQYMKNAEIKICVDVGIGGGHARVWTCDLTHAYISINADYRS